ncbi:hypothetical protein [Haladaptatus sp. W1]|uniref:hypothetical protein n=1 Tax=Haladaptatus sp. W1 TaxID=1897478 RepID=UPI0020C7E2FC|nr:hypothetical protein [Haladaptatus sp. W1]
MSDSSMAALPSTTVPSTGTRSPGRTRTRSPDTRSSTGTVSDRGYVETNEFLETSAEHVWAQGDVIGTYEFKHAADHETKYVVKTPSTESERRSSIRAWATRFSRHRRLPEREKRNKSWRMLGGSTPSVDVTTGRR